MEKSAAGMDGTAKGVTTSAMIEARIGTVAGRLAESLSTVLNAVPGGIDRPMELSRALGLNKDLASKVLIATRRQDPLAAAYLMPGSEALRTLLKAAIRKKVDRDVVRAAEAALAEFEDMVRTVAGSRASLDAMISGWLPEARTQFELANKQAAYKSTANLKGVTADLAIDATLVGPSATDPSRLDGVSVRGLRGLRRLRPGAPVHICCHLIGPAARTTPQLTLSGDPVDELSANTLLSEYSTHPLPPMKIRQADVTVHYEVDGDRLGLASAVDLYFGLVVPAFFRRWATPDSPGSRSRPALGTEVAVPCKAMVLDALVHESVWPRSDPDLLLYDTAVHGIAKPNDPARESDRLDLIEVIQPLGRGVASCRIGEIPRYVEMLRRACSQRGWDAEAFRCYRCRIEYPFYGAQVHMLFERSPRPPEQA
jgi:hypothetical protein